MAKKGSTLTLRLTPDENKKLTILKEVLRESAGTKAIMKAVEDVPGMREQIRELKSSLEKSESKFRQLEWNNSQIKKAIRDVLEFSKIAKSR